VTQKGTAPALPGQVDVLFDDGFRKANVSWNAYDPASYASEGEFVVTGNIAGIGSQARVTIYVVKSQPNNNALTAKPTASFSGGDGYPEALNNGFDPKSSADFSPTKGAANSAWHNWGKEGDPAWVMYQWDEAFLASSMDVYVFRDGSGNFQPTDMKLQLRDENGNWYTPRAVNGLGNALNKYNTTTFEPAAITGARLDMKPLTVGTGILEWKVNGYTSGADKTELARLYSYADALKAANFTGEGLAPIAGAKANAAAVMGNRTATEKEIAQAIEKLLTDLRLLTPRDNNMAFAAGVSASYTSSWESLPAVNDGRKDAANIPHWGTWGVTSSEEWVQYDWPQGANIRSSNLMLWTDNGGILGPSKITYSYIPKDSVTNEWVTAGTVTTGIVVKDTPVGANNIYEFNSLLEVKSLRVTLTKQIRDGNGVGLWEWEVFTAESNQNQPAPTTPAGIAPAAFNGSDGKLIGVTVKMEYRKDGLAEYTPITGDEVTGLTAGKYYVRYMKAGTLQPSPDKEVVIPDGEKYLSYRLSGPGSVQSGASFQLTYGLSNVTDSVYAKSVTVNYNPAELEFVGVSSLLDGFSVVGSVYGPGTYRIIEASTGPSPVTGTVDLLSLTFKALHQSVTTSVYMSGIVLGDQFGNEQIVSKGNAHLITIVAPDKTELSAILAEASEAVANAKVLNPDAPRFGYYPQSAIDGIKSAIAAAFAVSGQVDATQAQVDQARDALSLALTQFRAAASQLASIGDLAIIAANYNATSSSANWQSLRLFDADGNGKLDLFDLVSMARRILQ
jgi:hypothetical protein